MDSLYDAIGGLPALEVAVQQFSDRVARDPELASLFVAMDLHKLKCHLIVCLAEAIGGPIRYTGSTMRCVHAHLHNEQRHFEAVAHHLCETLRELGIDEAVAVFVMESVWPLATHIVSTRLKTAAVAN